jgi:hypothetical protein
MKFFLSLVPVFFILTNLGCSQNAKKDSGAADGVLTSSPAAVVSNENGVMVAKFDPAFAGAVEVSASGDSEIKGSAVVFSSGSLSEATEITLQQSSNLAENDVAAGLNLLEENPITAAGPAVVISSSVKVEVKRPFRVKLPLPAKAELQGSGLENLVVIYKAVKAADDGFIIGVIPLINLTVDGEFASITTNLFGAYQAVLTTTVIPDEVKEVSHVAVLSQIDWLAKVARNAAPNMRAMLVPTGLEERELSPAEDGQFFVQTVSESAFGAVNLYFEDADSDSLGISISGCPGWAECTIYDDISVKPSLEVKATPTREDAGDHVIEVTARDFFGEPVKWNLHLVVEVPTIYPPPVGLKFVDFPATQDAVSCLEYTIATVDKDGQITRPAETSVAFLGSGSGRFYKDNSCKIEKATDQVSFGPGNGIVKLFYSSQTPKATKLAVYAPEAWKWAAAYLDRDIVAGPTSQLQFADLPASIVANGCLLLTVMAADGVGNQRTAGAAINVGLVAQAGSFFTDPNCTAAVAIANQTTIGVDVGSADIYYKSTKAPGGPVSATATGLSGWKAGLISVEVTAGAISQIDFTIKPVSLLVGACTMIVVGTLDQFGNPSPVAADTVINLTSNVTDAAVAQYYSDAQCTVTSTSLTIVKDDPFASMKAYYKPVSKPVDNPPGTDFKVILTATEALTPFYTATVGNLSVATPVPP